jgi:magnesium transporter
MDSIENKEMKEFLSYEKSLVYVKTGLQWNDQMLEHLQGKAYFGWDDRDQELFEDVQIEYQQGYHMAETMLEVLEGTTDAFASLISNNLNVVMKFLAAVTIIMTVPTLIASIYGMNVTLPAEDAPYAFALLMLTSLLLALLVAWWFQRHGWLSFRLKRYNSDESRGN